MKKSFLSLLLSISIIGISLSGLTDVTKSQGTFSDVPSSHPYAEAINYVRNEGIVSGYPDGTYQPDRILNRAEFTKIIIESRFDENTISSCVNRNGFYEKAIFSDFDPGVWFEKYVCVAKSNSIIEGYPDGTFQPVKSIIFAEAAKIAIESYGFSTKPSEPWFAPYLNKFKEKNAIPPSIEKKSKDIDKAITELTRGEMADIIFRLRTVGDTILSDDGKFALRVTEKSLPETVSRRDITIRKVPPEKSPVKEVNGAPMVFYELQPSGLNFREPVAFTVETDTVANTIPMIFLISGEELDVIAEPIIEIDQNASRAFLSASLLHFSEVAIAHTKYFDVGAVEIIPPGDQASGNLFTTHVDIQHNLTPPTFILQSTGESISVSADWTLDGVFFEATPSSLMPYFITPPQIAKEIGKELYPTRARFDCNIFGAEETIVEYQGTVSYTFTYRNRGYVAESIIRSKSDTFSCKELDPISLQYELWRQFALDDLNRHRLENNKPPLRLNSDFNAIADIHARDLSFNIGSLTHTGSLGEESFVRIKEGRVIDLETGNYQLVPIPPNIDRSAENIGVLNVDDFRGSIEETIMNQHDLFMAAATEGITPRTTMLSESANFVEVGIGLYLEGNGNLWIVENFASFTN